VSTFEATAAECRKSPVGRFQCSL